MEMSINRVFEYLKEKGIKHTRFEKDVGLSNGYLMIQLSRGGALGEVVLNKIIQHCQDLNPLWLITGKGEKYNTGRDRPPIKIRAVDREEVETLPLLPIKAVVGLGKGGGGFAEQDIQGDYVVPEFQGIDFMIKVTGSTMYPKYNSGDVIACRKLGDDPIIQWNKVYVLSTKAQGLLVNRLKPSENKDSLLATSDNPDYDPFIIPKKELTGIALVIGVIRLE